MLEATGDIVDTNTLPSFEGTGDITSGGTENTNSGSLSTPGFDGFADLENILTGTDNDVLLTDQQLTQLKKFSDEAKTFLELGNKINDAVMRKYGSYVSVKADALIESIENKEQIDNAKID